MLLSLINRLNETESAVYNLWMLYFQGIPLSDYFEFADLTIYAKKG